MRLILVNQDLSGKTLKGEPFSYIGDCTGTDIKFTGDWKHVTLYQNDFRRPDWSQAETRYSYSRYNTFTKALVSQDVNVWDRDLVLAMFEEAVPRLEGDGLARTLAMLDEVKADKDYAKCWNDLVPTHGSLGGEFNQIVGGRKQFDLEVIKVFAGSTAQAEAEEPPPLPDGGIATSNWGVVARNHKTGKEYRKHWSELPEPTRPHDRVEQAELIEAEVGEFLGYPVTVQVETYRPWAARAIGNRHPRDWWM